MCVQSLVKRYVMYALIYLYFAWLVRGPFSLDGRGGGLKRDKRWVVWCMVYGADPYFVLYMHARGARIFNWYDPV